MYLREERPINNFFIINGMYNINGASDNKKYRLIFLILIIEFAIRIAMLIFISKTKRIPAFN